MSTRSKQTRASQTETTSAVVERLSWQTAQRDDRRVAQALDGEQEIDAMHELSEAGLLDEFFHFLEQLGVMQVIEKMDLAGLQRVLVPVVQFVLLYMLKVLLGIASMNALPRLLFSNVGLMQMIGFNATHIADGMTHRGDAQRKTKRKQGPLSAQCLAQNICVLTQEQMEWFFNQIIRLLVAAGFVQGKLLVALDGSKLPTPESYEGRGCLKVSQQVKPKGSSEKVTVEKLIYGWKVLVLIEVQTRLPLAMKIVPIQAYEGQYLLALVEQAQANVGSHAHIAKIVIDRGYLDGEDLWQLNERGIIFVVVGKAGMVVVEDARALAGRAEAVTRERVMRHGHGSKATTETLRTRLVGIEALTTYDAYGSAEHSKQQYRRDFEGHAINAVVVRTWNNRTPTEGGTVYLTNGEVRDPFVVFDDYDWRSVIENGIFKEGKHPWHLGRFPQKKEAAVIVHCFFTLSVMALCTAFRLWQVQGSPELGETAAAVPNLSSALLQGEGTLRWRQRLKEENRDKVIVFVGDSYGIFHLAELAVLTGMRLSLVPSHLGSRHDILARFGLCP